MDRDQIEHQIVKDLACFGRAIFGLEQHILERRTPQASKSSLRLPKSCSVGGQCFEGGCEDER